MLLSLVSIPLHELGPYTVYKLADIPVHRNLSDARPAGSISGPVAELVLVAGPAYSMIAAVVCLLIARRLGFFWPTAAFTNATIRLLPCVMDLLRVFQGGTPFSDEVYPTLDL